MIRKYIPIPIGEKFIMGTSNYPVQGRPVAAKRVAAKPAQGFAGLRSRFSGFAGRVPPLSPSNNRFFRHAVAPVA